MAARVGDAAYALDSSFANPFNDRLSTYFYYEGELGRKDYQSTNVTGGGRVAF